MIPPRGFKNELYPLRHEIIYAFGLSAETSTMSKFFATFIRHTNDVIAGTPGSIVVNPHNTNYVEDKGPAVCKMSIIDKLSLSMKFNLTENFDVDSMQALKFSWRPIFFSFNEKLAAADDDTGTTVESLLGLTSDATFEDVVPVTTNKLPVIGASDLSHPASTVNIAEVFGDYNMTTNLTCEDHIFDETTFQRAMRRYTNKGALKSMVGKTRHVTLSKNKTFHNVFIKKFVPKSVRRIMPYSFFGIQVYVPPTPAINSPYHATALTGSIAHLGCKIICLYDEWNADHYQEMSGTAP